MTEVLLAYYSRYGSVASMAEYVAEGVESVNGCHATIRRVANISSNTQQSEPTIPHKGVLYASNDDLKNCDALIIGSPSYFGNMAAPLKFFLDQTSPLWLSGAMIGKPAGVFSSASSLHGGIESVLTSMMIPLLHHGMLICGLPYSESSLHDELSAAAPYGAAHIAFNENTPVNEQEATACKALGKRVADLANRLK